MKKKNEAAKLAGIVLKTFGISILTMWAFFDFSVVSFGVLLAAPLDILRERKRLEKESRWNLTLAFKDSLLYFRNALTAGYSPENGMRETLKGLEQMYHRGHDICKEYRRMITGMELGSSMEKVWLAFGERSASEDIRQFAEILSVVKRTGGDLSLILRQSGDILQDKIELKRELRAAVAAKESEFRIMCVLPYAILFYLKLFAPSMSELLYHNTFGIVFMWGVFLCYQGFRYLGEKIIQREMLG